VKSFTTGRKVDPTFGIFLLQLAVQRAVLEQPLADFFGQQFHLRLLRLVTAQQLRIGLATLRRKLNSYKRKG
jgi:hypothetical protein